MYQFVQKRFDIVFPSDLFVEVMCLLFLELNLWNNAIILIYDDLVQAEHLEALLEPLGKHVRSYYGNQGGGTLPKDTSVAVCTIEKANSLINRLLEEGRLSEVGIIVIDELHMVLASHLDECSWTAFPLHY